MTKPLILPTAPFSVRFTNEERVQLQTRARHQPLGTFIREAALLRAGVAVKQSAVLRIPTDADRQLAQALSALGRDGLAASISSMARSAQSGLLIITPETDRLLLEACGDIREVRDQVLAYLRLLKGVS